MKRLQKLSSLIAVTFIGVILYGGASLVHAQTSPSPALESKTRGIEMYKQGDIKGAIKTLRAAIKLDRTDPETFYHLGRSLAADDEIKDARRAFEEAVRLRSDMTDARSGLAHMFLLEKKANEAIREAEIVLNTTERNAEAHYVLGEIRLSANSPRTALLEAEKAIAINPDFELAVLLKARAVRAIVFSEYPAATKQQVALLVSMSKETAAALDSFMKRNSKPANLERLMSLQFELRPYGEGNFDEFVYKSKDVSEKALILSKPGPVGPGAEGVVVLQAILHRNGKVEEIRVISTPDRETAIMCIEAAQKIKFTPARKDGRPVSQYIRVEYIFHRAE